MSDVTDLKAEILLLRRENAELRELVSKTWKWSESGCHECPKERDCKVQFVYDGDCGMALEIEHDMRELGVVK